MIGANDDSGRSSFSADGRLLVFESAATNLVPGDTGGQGDIFLRDLQSGSTVRISSGLVSSEANSFSANPDISADGTKIVFESLADNLANGDSNAASDVFIFDIVSNQTIRLSVSSTGTDTDGASVAPKISRDGSVVAFTSAATNLVSGDINQATDVFITHVLGNTTSLVSSSASGIQGNSDSWDARPTLQDGARVFFNSFADNLVSNDTNGTNDIFVKNITTGSVDRVNTSSSGNQANDLSRLEAVTPDGRYVLFQSYADNLVANDTNQVRDLFRKDTVSGEVVRVNTASDGTEANAETSTGFLSANGRFVVFESAATNLSPNDANGSDDVFVKDLASGKVAKLSADIVGRALDASSSVSGISDDGRFIAFRTAAPGVTFDDAGDQTDIFTVPNPLYFNAPTVTVAARAIDRGVTLQAPDLFTIADADNDPIAEVELFDRNSDSNSGYFSLGGVPLKGGEYQLLNGSSLGSLSFVSASPVDHSVTDGVSVRAYDGTNWGAWENFTITTKFNSAPVVQTTAFSLRRHKSVSSTQFAVISDPNGDPIQKVEVEDANTAPESGRLRLDRVDLAAGSPIDLSVAEFERLTFVGGTPINLIGGSTASTVDSIQIRAFDGVEWSGWSTAELTTTSSNFVPSVQLRPQPTLQSGQTLSFGAIVQTLDRNGDSIVAYQVRDHNSTSNSGAWYDGATRLVEGQGVDGQWQSTNIAAADVDQTYFTAGTPAGGTIVDDLEVRAFDGVDWSSWASLSITTSSGNTAPIITTQDQSIERGMKVGAAAFFSVTDLNNTTPSKIEISGAAGAAGKWYLNDTVVTPAQDGSFITDWSALGSLQYRAPVDLVGNASDTFRVRVFDGVDWSHASDVHISLLAGNTAPDIIQFTKVLERNQSIQASSVFGATDRNGNSITAYEFAPDPLNPTSAHWTLGGTTFAGGVISPVQFQTLVLVGAPTSGGTTEDHFAVRASDGTVWSGWTPLTVITSGVNQAPQLFPADVFVQPAQSVHLTGSVTISDGNGDAITRYQVIESDTSPSSAHLIYNGAPVVSSTAAPFEFTDLGKLEVIGGSATADESVNLRASDGIAWSDWTNIAIHTTPFAANEPHVYEGDDGDNTITALEGDSIYAKGGADLILLTGSPMKIDGGPGFDVAHVRAGNSAAFTAGFVTGIERVDVEDSAAVDASQLTSGLTFQSLSTNGGFSFIVGTAGGDKITGGAGDDIIDGYGGPDIIDGGAGNDLAVYHENAATYDVFSNNGILYVFSHGIEGQDQLRNVENIQFADASIVSGSVSSFNSWEYLASNPDLIGPLGRNLRAAADHYVSNGFQEGRSRSSFDPLNYVASNPDLIGSVGVNGLVAEQHYVTTGLQEGRSTSAFDPLEYLASNPDLILAIGYNVTGAEKHYIQAGFSEHRATNLFDPLEYLASNPDLIRAFGVNTAAAEEHYVLLGLNEGRATKSFDPLAYLASNPDLIRAFGLDQGAALNHYVQTGVNEGRSTHSFDTLEYLVSNGDLIQAFGFDPAAAYQHYLHYGFHEGRATASFDALEYLASNPDLIRAGGLNPLAAERHYATNGYTEHRPTNSFDALEYLASNADLIVAFGLDPNAAFQHYLHYGYNEGRVTASFDALEYLASNPDLIRAGGLDLAAAERHYVANGFNEHRATHSFDALEYLASNADLIHFLGLDPAAAYQHWLHNGYNEGRATASFNAAQYLANNADLSALFGANNLAAARQHYITNGLAEGRTDKAPVINGDGGNNNLVVKNGAIMTGGGGADNFVFNLSPQTPATITDFTVGTDHLQTLASSFGHGLTAAGSPTLVTAATASAATHAGTDGYFIFDNDHTVWWDPTGGSGADAIALAKLTGVAALHTTDFLLV